MIQLYVRANQFSLMENLLYLIFLTHKWILIQGGSHDVQLPKIPAHTIARVDTWVGLDQEGGHMVHGR